MIVLIFFCTLSSVFARIGETQQACSQRYGPPIKSQNKYVVFQKNGFLIGVTFHEGKADSISYRKAEQNVLGKGVEISENEIQQILSLNGSGQEWKKITAISMERKWQTEDGETFGFYMTVDHILSIGTRGYYERLNNQKKEKENKGLEGF